MRGCPARTSVITIVLAATLAGLALAACGDDATADASPPEVTAARAPAPASPDVAAVYLEIGDPGEPGDRLVGASTDVAERVEVHESTIGDDGIARMEQREDGIEVRAGEGVALEPGGLHLMLINPEPLSAGQRFELTLEFARGELRTVEVAVTDDEAHERE